MCGIIAAFNFEENKDKDVNEDILEQYQDQRTRGTDGFGYALINNDGTFKIGRATDETKMLVDINMNKSQMIIMHHRTPTSSENKIQQTHPIVIDSGSLKYKYFIVHNGIIRNDDELVKLHKELGFIYSTEYTEITKWNDKEKIKFNDSESLGIELARFIEGQTTEMNIKGGFAFIIAQVEKKGDKVENIYFGRNNSQPLTLSKTRGKMKLSSEGKGSEVKPDILYHCDIKDFEIKKKELKVKAEEVVTYSDVCAYPGQYNNYRRPEYESGYSYSSKVTSLVDREKDKDKENPANTKIKEDEDEIEEVAEEFDTRMTSITDKLVEGLKDKDFFYCLNRDLFKNTLISIFEETFDLVQQIREEQNAIKYGMSDEGYMSDDVPFFTNDEPKKKKKKGKYKSLKDHLQKMI